MGHGPRSAASATLEAILTAAVRAVHAGDAVTRSLRRHPSGDLELAGLRIAAGTRLRVAAVGKAASAMAEAFEAAAAESIERGLVVTKAGHARPNDRFEVLEAGHPVPDERSQTAAGRLLALAASGGPGDVFVLLLSGGASALLSHPLASLARADLARTTELLLGCGADIKALNCVRKHLSSVAGGRLARASAASRVVVLAVSDVPGDDLSVIGSGPCEVDPTTFGDALGVVDRFQLRDALPEAVVRHLEAGAAGRIAESAKPGEPGLPDVYSAVVARSEDAVDAAVAEAERRGLRAVRLGPVLRGEARERGRALAELALALDAGEAICAIASGETTVSLRGAGVGGRNQELALAAALVLEGSAGRSLLAAGTDGTDGPTDAAGAFVDGDTLARGRAHGRDAAAHRAENDSYGFFSLEGGLLRTGPTDTNVMDLALLGVGIENR